VSGLCGSFGTEAKSKGAPPQNLRCKTKKKSLSASTPEVTHHIKESSPPLSGPERSGVPYGSRLGSNGSLKNKHPEKVRKAKSKPPKFSELRWFWYALRDSPPGLLVRSLSEDLRQMLSGPFGAVLSGFEPPFVLSAPLTPRGNFLFWVRLWVSGSKAVPENAVTHLELTALFQKAPILHQGNSHICGICNFCAANAAGIEKILILRQPLTDRL